MGNMGGDGHCLRITIKGTLKIRLWGGESPEGIHTWGVGGDAKKLQLVNFLGDIERMEGGRRGPKSTRLLLKREKVSRTPIKGLG